MKLRIRTLCLSVLALIAAALLSAPAYAQPQPFVINEVLVGNASVNLDPTYTNYSPWVELRNNTGANINLGGYKFEFDPDGSVPLQRHVLPNGTILPANGYLLLWADEEGKDTHAGFELDMDGGVITIRNAADAIIDSLELGEQSPDISYGRLSTTPATWAYYDQPTPGAANSTTSYATQIIAERPTFDTVGGRYNAAQTLTLGTTEPGGTIRYTTDGSIPTRQSTAYTSPIAINTTTMVRARVFVDGTKMSSPTVTHTYLINVPNHLPIVSLTTADANLFDARIGIYVKGVNGALNCKQRANWNQSWTRPANIEFYETGGAQVVNQEVGLEIHGNCSRNYDQKSFEIKARKVYGDNTMDYAFFDSKPMTQYKRLILRNSGQDIYAAMLRDEMVQTIISGRMDIDSQAYRPAVVYLNGQYWGIYDMREKMDEDYVENNYGLDEETDFDMLEQNARPMAGNDEAWNQFIKDLTRMDLSKPSDYAQLRTMMDVDEFMNYLIVQYFSSNTDWPRNNVRFWNDYGPDYGWRWALYDLDLSWTLKKQKQNMITWSKLRGGPTSLVIRRVLASPDFRAEFAQRFAAHMNTTFEPTRVIGLIDQLSQEIAPAMPDHIARWNRPTAAHWQKSVQELRDFVTRRPQYMRAHLRTLVNKAGDAWLTINVDGDGDGHVLVAGAPVEGGYRGLHFRGVPMTLTAVESPGSKFVSWSSGETTRSITIPFGEDTSRTATFAPDALPNVIITEVHYKPASSQGSDDDYEFVEIYNAGSTAVDISGYTFSNGFTATIPEGITMAAGEYIVIAQNPATYQKPGLQVFPISSGGLSSSGEKFVFSNKLGAEVDSLDYKSVAPWPTEPNGTGPTMALRPPAEGVELNNLYNDAGANWAASRETGGTPGAENFPPLPEVPSVIINEIHYNPADSQGADTDYEFIELVNTGDEAVELGGFTLSGLIAYTFPVTATIDPGAYLVVAANSATYAGSLGWTSGALADDGGRVTLSDDNSQLVDEVTYGVANPWPAEPNGSGPSLSLGRTALDNAVAANWGASRTDNGTPGAVNFPPLPLVINELHHTPSSSQGTDDAYEFLEIVNTGAETESLAGFTLFGVEFKFPADATIAPGEYIVVADTPASYAGGDYQVFDFSGGLSSSGELVTLSDQFGNLIDAVDYKTASPWPAEPKGTGPSLSLKDPALDNSAAANWAASRETGGTPGAINFPPLPPSILINEIHYNPADSQGADVDYEFIELVNTGDEAVELGDFTLSGLITYTFPVTATIEPDAYLVVAANRATHAGSLGWTSGALADDGGRVTLRDAFDQLVDEVTYGVADPWPAEPNGSGPSLSLGLTTLDNSLPASWAASDEDGGTPGAENFGLLPLVINEVHYNPADSQGADADYEFIEIYNAGSQTYRLGGYAAAGITYTFPVTATIEPGAFLLLVNGASTAYDAASCSVYKWTEGDLSDVGETLSLLNRFGTARATLSYGNGVDDAWPERPNGNGPSLSLDAPYLNSTKPGNWSPSSQVGGSPCEANFSFRNRPAR